MKFQKNNFSYSCGWLTYNNEFVARFKHTPRDKGPFVTFLIKHFEVEEYFELRKTLTPILVLKTKGYVSSTIKLLLKYVGYPQTQEGFETYLNDKYPKEV